MMNVNLSDNTVIMLIYIGSLLAIFGIFDLCLWLYIKWQARKERLNRLFNYRF
jgi:hypothetical protein